MGELEVRKSQMELQQSQENEKRLQSLFDKSTQENEALKEDKDYVEQQFKDVDDERKKLEKENQKLHQKLADEKTQHASEIEELKQTAAADAEADAEKKYSDKISSLETQLADAQKDKTIDITETAEFKELKKQLNEAEAKNNSLENDAEKLTEAIVALQDLENLLKAAEKLDTADNRPYILNAMLKLQKFPPQFISRFDNMIKYLTHVNNFILENKAAIEDLDK